MKKKRIIFTCCLFIGTGCILIALGRGQWNHPGSQSPLMGKDSLQDLASFFQTPKDLLLLDSFMESAKKQRLDTSYLNKRIIKTALYFLGTPYVSGTLETSPKEKLSVNLREMDCVTLVDHVLSLSLLDRYGKDKIPEYLENLKKVRYRNAMIDGYASRLHYSSDWFFEMQKTGILKDITAENHGIPFPNRVGYMSGHPEKYPALEKDSSQTARMKEIETEINSRPMFYIPKDSLKTNNTGIKSGDIILITTSIPGLDMAHVGIAIEHNNRIHLLHASSKQGKVMVSEEPLDDYLKHNRHFSGIMIGRIK